MRIVQTLCIFFLLNCALFAQFDSGQISGFVRDETGAVVPGAAVAVANQATGENHRAATNASGYYTFPQLFVGKYDLTVEAPGFKKFVQRGVVLDSQAKVSVDVGLTVGAVTEQVEVTSDVAQLKTDSADVGTTIDTKQIQNLTLNGRNPIYIAALSPGVQGGAGIGTFDPDSVSNGSFNINGGRPDEYVVMIDGAVATRTRSSGSMLGAMDVDAVQEVQVLTADYSAEYGRASAGQIRFVTKSGGNKFHGDLVENFRNSALDANTWTRNHSAVGNIASGAAPYRFNQYGFDIGGPVFIPKKFNSDRSKLFFFGAEEWIARRYDTTNTGTVPSLAMRAGDFSELLSASNALYKKVRLVNDPSNNTPFPGNIIPASRLSPNGVALLNIYPQPVPGFLQGSSNWIGTKSTHTDLRKDTYKVDYVISQSEHFSVRIGNTPWNFNSPFEDTFGRMEEVWSRPNRVGAASLISTFTPTLVNEFNFSANSDGKGLIGFGSYCTACLRSTYGVNYPYLFPGTKIAPQKVPSLRVQGLTTLDAGPYPGSWAGYVYGWTDTLTKIVGGHTMKFGAYLEHAGQNDFIQGTTVGPGATVNQNGDFTFNDTGGTPKTSGLSIANAALGNFDTYSEFGAKAYTPYVSTSLDIFAQDSWKVNPKLNISFGLRWSLWPDWSSKWGNISEFLPQYYNPATAPVVDPKGGFIVSGNQYDGIVLPGNGVPSAAGHRIPALDSGLYTSLYHNLPDALSPTQWKVFQPRLGIAYALTPKTAIRAGIGSFANRVAINRDTALGGNAPFQIQESVVNGLVDQPGGAVARPFPFTQTIQDPVFKIPTAWEWNTTFQREVLKGTTVEIAYVGRRGLHNQRKRNLNQLLPGTLQANPGINANALRPYQGYGVVAISENSGQSRYNGMQLSIQRRYSNGLQFGLAYTFAKSSDDASSLTDVLPNAYNGRGYYGPSDFDRRHVFVANYIYELPFFKNGNRILKSTVGGWELSGVNQFQSGLPYSVRTSVDIAGVGTGSGNQFWNLAGDPSTSTSSFGNYATWFNPAAFTIPTAGTFGTGPRNVIRGPSFWTWDMSLRKNVRIYESSSLQFRFEMFDILNHPNWSAPVVDPTNGSFGRITGKTNDTRQLQLAMKFIF
jgi:hypothetical protein